MIAIINDYRSDMPSTYEIEDELKKIAKAGFTHVHWAQDWVGEYIYSDIEMDQVKYWLSKYGLKAKGVHASEGGKRSITIDGQYKIIHSIRNTFENRKDFTSINEYNRLAGVELLKNRVDLSKRIDAHEIVLHIQYPYEELSKSKANYDLYWQQLFRSFDELENYCKAKGVKIAVENLLYTPVEKQMELFDKLFSRYDHDFLGFCFDSGHGLIMTENNPMEFAEKYNDRIIAIHLTDNDGLDKKDVIEGNILEMEKSDSHRNPFNGISKWNHLMKIIAKSPYELPITLESCLNKDEKEEAFLREGYEAGLKLTDMFNKYRMSTCR